MYDTDSAVNKMTVTLLFLHNNARAAVTGTAAQIYLVAESSQVQPIAAAK